MILDRRLVRPIKMSVWSLLLIGIALIVAQSRLFRKYTPELSRTEMESISGQCVPKCTQYWNHCIDSDGCMQYNGNEQTCRLLGWAAVNGSGIHDWLCNGTPSAACQVSNLTFCYWRQSCVWDPEDYICGTSVLRGDPTYAYSDCNPK